MDITNEQFITCLRSALNHLYDPDQLRHNPLTILFGLAGRVDASSALQKILLEAIEELKPGDHEPEQASGWQIYGVLFFRYVRGYAREAIANQLGISDRQLSREQRAALETLALCLWRRYRLVSSQQDVSSAVPPRGAAPALADSPAAGESSWIEALPAEKPSSWKSVLVSVLDLLGPLIRQHEVTVWYEPDGNLPDLIVPLVALRHSLLNILGLIIPLAKGGELILTPTVEGQVLAIKAEVPLLVPASSSFLPSHPNIEVARHLIERAGGNLTISSGAVNFSLPTLAQIPILVIDDNADILQLFQRYAQGSRYAVTGVQQPAVAYTLIEAIRPRVIVMDVMMPDLDGWDLLTQLRQDHRFQDTTIIVCSILPQEELARSLGANGFLQKPVLPQDFLKELDLQIDASVDNP